MKWINFLVYGSFAIIAFSCHKPKEEPQVIVSKTKVKKGEMITATVINQPAGTSIAWWFPNYKEMMDVSPDNKTVRVLFIKGKEKEFTIQAGLIAKGDSLPSAYIYKNIEVENDYFKIPDNLPENALQPITGERLTLSPVLMEDGTLSFAFYCWPAASCFNSYVVTRDVTISNGNIKATINKVWTPDHCEPVTAPACGELFTHHIYKDGKYAIEINFYNKTYQGILEVSNNGKCYAFDGTSPTFLSFDNKAGFDFSFSYSNGGRVPVYTAF